MAFLRPSKPFKKSGLGMHWDTEDPFIFVSHHEDDYPQGNRQQAPPLREISGRNLGRDYQLKLGFRMYHGKVVPGFPMHAHWGYETLTVPEIGYIDHFDTERIEGRFGFGDVQWVSASSKYEHCEMYPLADQENRNPNDITQIMINLPLEMTKGKGRSLRLCIIGEKAKHLPLAALIAAPGHHSAGGARRTCKHGQLLRV